MRTLIDFGRSPITYEVTDEEFAEWERLNAKQIETRRIMASHDEAQALNNARRQEREYWQRFFADKDAVLADKDAEIADKDAEIARLLAQLDK